MKNLLITTAVICSGLLVTVLAVPVPEAKPKPAPAPAPEPKTDIELMKIPLDDDKELDVITLVDSEDQRINERNKRTIGILRELFPTLSQITSDQDSQNTLETLDLAGLSDTLNAIRVARATAEETKSVSDGDDQKGAESSGKSSALDELSLDSEGNDEDRNKRFLSFGGSSAGGAGGSGNFLFDIIRQTADRAARAAGTVYRVVAGTESLTTDHDKNANDEGRLSASSSSSYTTTSSSSSHSALISGSSGTEQSDEKANSPDDDHDLGKGDGYTEGIPGPVTRLFVLANRGLSNLIQDLILRIAQTSERVVNFKARLITSLI
ncbi:clumping factor B isoform X3 [Wyeomyia smithii]|uniref:clumping factor B isoform X3 n=1 Tax=Wyeomyia smithii TaxID=174621 RepID=UPI00246807EF|nr:clumping factor B isoform X3 [Wyeomyia smithii]